MAKMYPPFVDAKTKSEAERVLFKTIRDELPDKEWIGLHSLGIANHQGKPWAEMDFVLIGPTGVYGLEVKGGRISRADGEWIFTNRHGASNTKREGPFEQVGVATSVLRKHLYERLPNSRACLVGYGVATPDVPFDVRGPDVEPEVVYDIEDVSHPFSKYADRLGKYWIDRVTTQRKGRSPSSLNLAMRQAVLGELRGDFDLKPSLKQRIGLVDTELFSLTEEQYKVLDSLVDNERVLIRGGAGTGKTLLVVEEAIRQSQLGKSVLVCCFNKQLADHIRSALDGHKGVTVCHLHGLMGELIKEAGKQADLPDAREQDVFTVYYPLVALDAIGELERADDCEVLIMDEAQDLMLDGYLDVLDTLLVGGLKDGVWRAFLDPKQNIFEATDPAGLRRLLAERPAQHRLHLNCRNTAAIASATSLLSTVDQDEECRAEGPDVEYYWYRDDAHGSRLVSKQINRILSEGVKPEDIVVLSPRRLDNSSLRGGLPDVPYSLVDASQHPEGRGQAIRFATVSSYKGLEADVVLLVDVDNLEDKHALSNLYVGTSRARAVLAVFLKETVREDFSKLAESLGKRMVEASGGSSRAEVDKT